MQELRQAAAQQGQVLVMLYMALRLKRLRESGEWQPDELEWVQDDRLFTHQFNDVVIFCKGEVDAVLGVLEVSAG